MSTYFTYSVVNGKLMRATATARVEVLPSEAARTLNDLVTALRSLVAAVEGGDWTVIDMRVEQACAAIAAATGEKS